MAWLLSKNGDELIETKHIRRVDRSIYTISSNDDIHVEIAKFNTGEEVKNNFKEIINWLNKDGKGVFIFKGDTRAPGRPFGLPG